MAGTIQVEVRRRKNESSTSLIRRFSRRAKDLNLVRSIRNHRYYVRTESKNVERRRALVSLARRKNYHELVKLGKIDPAARKNRRHK